jgi:2-amino-4-hydroxy-6-hydroxymethyldihydropteridine diphosphokinase
MPRCHLALGGNVGPVAATFRRARELLTQADCRLVAASRCYRTRAVGGAGGEFLNAAAAIETPHAPGELLARLQAIESELGRVRAGHWGPRTIDLDLIFYGDAVIASPRLTVPHRLCWFRRFVLDPLGEIAGEVVHPVKRVSVARLRDRLRERPLTIELAGDESGPAVAELVARLTTEFPEVRLGSGHSEPAFVFRLESPPAPTGSLSKAGDRRPAADASPPDACAATEPVSVLRQADEPPDSPGRTIVIPGEDALGEVRAVLQSALGACVATEATW